MSLKRPQSLKLNFEFKLHNNTNTHYLAWDEIS